MNKLHVKLNIQRFASDMTITCVETGTNTANNTSSITLTVKIQRRSGSSDYWIKPNYRALTVTTSDGQTQSVNTQYPSNKSYVTFDFDFTIPHNNDGTGYVEFTANLAKLSSSLPALSASGEATLTTIPRYFSSSPTLTLVSKTETSVTLKWTTPENCDQVQYKIGSGGSWVNVSGTGTSGTYTITGLTPNTSYTFYGDYKRADSQLWSTWGGYTVSVSPKTYDYPKASVVNDIILKENTTMTIGFDNPLSKTFSYQIISNINDTVIYTASDVNITSDTLNMNDLLTAFYNTIPNDPEATYYVKATYNSNVRTSASKKYTIDANTCKPEMSVVSYEDVNATTLALTGDDQKLVYGQSVIQITIADGNKATPKYGATIVKYKIKNGDNDSEANESVGNDVVLSCLATSSIIEVYAIDSRGQSGVYTIANADLINYTPITKNQNPVAQRCDSQGIPNGVGEYTLITLGGTFWNNTFGSVSNTIQNISYEYIDNRDPEHPQTGATTITATTNNNDYSVSQLILGDTQHGFDVGNSYTIFVTVSDKLSSIMFTMTLGSGTPHICYDDDGIGIMKKFDTSNSSSLQVDGEIDCAGYNLNGTPLAFPIVHDSYDTSTTETYSCNYVNGLIDIFYPVGSYYETSDTSFNPNTAWGGTWVEDSKGRFLLSTGIPEANTDNYFGAMSGTQYSCGVGSRGGQDYASNNLSDNGYAKIQLRSTGAIEYRELNVSAYTFNYKSQASSGSSSTDTGHYGAALGGKTDIGNNMPPYVGVKRWHRTA